MWTPPEDVERVLVLLAERRVNQLFRALPEEQQRIANKMSAAGTVNSGGYFVAVVTRVGELIQEAGNGLASDHLQIATDIHAGTDELMALEARVLEVLRLEEYRLVDWLSHFLAKHMDLWPPMLKRLQASTSEARRDVVIAFSRESVRRQHSTRISSIQSTEVRDFFLSHAGEDKAVIARPLADELRRCGHSIWFDQFELTVGDSLTQRIDKGIVDSRFGIVVLSPSFFAKPWTRYELDGLVARSIAEDRKVILPVWHNVTRDDIIQRSPKLADLVGVSSHLDVSRIAEELINALRAAHW